MASMVNMVDKLMLWNEAKASPAYLWGMEEAGRYKVIVGKGFGRGRDKGLACRTLDDLHRTFTAQEVALRKAGYVRRREPAPVAGG